MPIGVQLRSIPTIPKLGVAISVPCNYVSITRDAQRPNTRCRLPGTATRSPSDTVDAAVNARRDNTLSVVCPLHGEYASLHPGQTSPICQASLHTHTALTVPARAAVLPEPYTTVLAGNRYMHLLLRFVQHLG
eukprot:scaffold3043_cov360-Prasinococcus_capsulatus_cf.AAC.4